MCSVINPPTRGPITGPRRGASVYIPVDRLRSSFAQQSTRIPAAIVKGALHECQLINFQLKRKDGRMKMYLAPRPNEYVRIDLSLLVETPHQLGI